MGQKCTGCKETLTADKLCILLIEQVESTLQPE